MPANRLNTRFNTRDDVWDSITPNWRVQDKISAPHGEWKPAGWLPIQFTKSNIGAGSDAFVISSGKVVAMDREGRIVPAGLRAALVAASGNVLSYTSTDVEWGVYDITTGDRVAAAVSYTTLQIAKALVERGLVDPNETTSNNNPPSTSTDAEEIIEAFISQAIGVVAYDVHVWSGRPEDGDQWMTNYSKQHLIQFLTEVQAEVPHMAYDTVGTTGAIDVSAITLSSSVTAGSWPSAGSVLNATGISTWERYNDVATTDSLVAIPLSHRNLANYTSRTTFTCDVSGVLTDRKTSWEDISAEGDWYLDAGAGVLFLHSDTWTTLVADDSDPTFTYYYYSAGATADSDRYIHFTGDGKAGDFVSCDQHSNFCVMGSADDIYGTSNVRSLGRLHRFVTEPRDLLDKVKTAFDLSEMSASAKMPGSATQGFSDKITLSAEDVADQLAVITVRV